MDKKMMMKKFFKWYVVILIGLLLSSCYENETVIIDESEAANLRMDDELTVLMKSVTSNDGGFDDFIDGAHCFHINFPYQIQVNEDVINIDSKEDLDMLSNLESEMEIVYPVSISLTNFEIHSISSGIEMQSLQQMCADGLFYDEHINCAEFIYPLELSIYNTSSRRFDKQIFNSNKETFLFLENMDENSIFEIVYPANIFMFHENHFSIESNFGLSAHFKIAHNTCGIRD